MKRWAVLLAVAACAPKPPAAPAPTQFHSAKPAREVVQSASRVLTEAGFEVTTSDAGGGVLTAKRTGNGPSALEYATCIGAKGSAIERERSALLTLSLSARDVASGSDVTLSARVASTYPNMRGMMALPPSDTDCASNGTIEGRIADAVK